MELLAISSFFEFLASKADDKNVVKRGLDQIMRVIARLRSEVDS